MSDSATSMTPWRQTQGRVLAIETSGPVASIAIGTAGGIVREHTVDSDLRHGAALLPAIQDASAAAGWPPESFDACFVSIGPGSFTGLRVGVTIARTLAWSLGLRLVAVPTAEAIAQNGFDGADGPQSLGVMFNAGRGRVFGVRLARGAAGFETVDGPHEVDAKNWLGELPAGTIVTGEAAAEHDAVIRDSGLSVWPAERAGATAGGVFAVGMRRANTGQFTPPRELKPLYIRLPSAVEKLNAGLLRSKRKSEPAS